MRPISDGQRLPDYETGSNSNQIKLLPFNANMEEMRTFNFGFVCASIFLVFLFHFILLAVVICFRSIFSAFVNLEFNIRVFSRFVDQKLQGDVNKYDTLPI